MIGRLDTVVIDCPDPQALSAFYRELLGMHVVKDEGDWVTIRTDSDAPPIAFQKVADLRAPAWPDPALGGGPPVGRHRFPSRRP